ncbi:MFS transporter [Deinococcus apachensis]|uniref:MFS transporter n=1 Tax=Deinococcus apachensis TaxID=309886 RepID=UPI00146D8250|nr:MFS transporter [Deinococcus apachensis]
MSISLLHGPFARVWWAGLISMTGNWMLAAALPAYVYLATGSVLASSLMFLASVVPHVLLGSLAGALADRVDRVALMTRLNLLAAASVLPLLLAAPSSMWPVVLVCVLETLVTLPLGPAENALLPTLVPPTRLPRANALNALNNNIARLLGPALGGLVLARAGLSAVVLLDVASYVVAAALLWPLVPARSTRGAVRINLKVVRQAGQALVNVSRDGLRLAREVPALRLLLLTTALGGVGEGLFAVLLAPFVVSVLRGDAGAYGLIISAQAVGGLIGAVVMTPLAGRWSPVTLAASGALGLGVIDALIFASPLVLSGVWPATLLMILAGLPASAGGVGWTTLMQRVTVDERRGQAFGVSAQVSALSVLAGTGLANAARTPDAILPVISVHAVTLLTSGVIVALRRRVLNVPSADAPRDGQESLPG